MNRALAADGQRIAAALQGKTLLPGCGGRETGDRGARECGRLGRLRAGQGLGELADAPFHQQPAGQLDQVQRRDRPYPFAGTLFGQAFGLAFDQRTVVTRHVAFDQLLHLGRLGLPETGNRLWRVEPTEEQIADAVLPLLERDLLRPEIARALGVDRDDLIGQQAQVVLGVGVADAITQPTFILRPDMRYAKTGATDLGTGLLPIVLRIDHGAEPEGDPQKSACEANPR